MSSPPPLREIIDRHKLSASKALGQNFLLDSQLLARIARVPGDLRGKIVYEVGPGPGGLTRALIEAGARVVAIERDKRCIPILHELGQIFPDRLSVIEGDALRIDGRHVVGEGAHIAANLPYNIGTALLVRWLNETEWPPWWASLTLMFQREVAERITASPGTPAYGRLSVLAQWRCQAQIAVKVHRSAFVPPPKIMSAVVHIVPKPPPAGVSAQTLERITAAAFGQRRKMLRRSLAALPAALKALDRLGIDNTRRAETLTVEEYIALARAMEKPGSKPA